MTKQRQNILFLLLTGSFAVVNILTITWFPQVWIDEVLSIDPSLRYVINKGFTSTAWYSQDSTQFWASNLPLHEYLLIPWFKIFGVSITAARSVCIFYFLLASIVLWRWMDIAGFIKDYKLKILFITVLWAGHDIVTIYRNARYDALTILVATLVLLIYFSKSPYRKWLTVLIGVISLLSGLQLPPFIVIVLAFAWLAVKEYRRELFRFGVHYCVGVFAGLGALLAFLYTQGVAYTFLAMTFASGFTIVGEGLQIALYADSKVNNRISRRLYDILHFYRHYTRDFSAVILSLYLALVTIICTAAYKKYCKELYAARFMALYLLIPVAMLILGRYKYYYSWMNYIVVLIGVFYVMDRLKHRTIKTLGIIAVCLAVLAGLPYQFYKYGNKELVKLLAIEDSVAEHINKEDYVFADYIAYYSCIKHAGEYYSPVYSGGRGFPVMHPHERQRINKLIISPHKLKAAINKVGGEWVDIAGIKGTGLVIYKRKR